MAQVTVRINNRDYTMQCAEGEEAQLLALAAAFDGEIAALRKSLGLSDELRLLIMAGLTLADRALDSEARAASVEQEMRLARAARPSVVSLASRLISAAEKLERLAAQANASPAPAEPILPSPRI